MKIDTNNGEDADDKAGTETAVGAKEVVYIYVCVVHFTVNVSLLFSTYFFNLLLAKVENANENISSSPGANKVIYI